MSDHSIEHSLVFNTAKRVLRFIAPDFRVIARTDLPGNQCRIDLRHNMLEVPEGMAFRAAGMIIFNAGILRLKDDPRFSAVFGNIDGSRSDEEAIKDTASQHALADEDAYQWALKTMSSYFPELDEANINKFVDHRQSYETWLKYFSSYGSM